MSGSDLPLSLELRLEEVCTAFEAAWKAGQRPRIEDYLTDLTEPQHSVLLLELLRVELEYRCRSQEIPAEEEYRLRFPGHGALISAVVCQGRPPANPAAGPNGDDQPTKAGNETPSSPEAMTLALQESAWIAPADFPSQVGAYQVLGALGKGGMGIVYKAMQRGLNRVVALKMLLGGQYAGPEELARFRQEAEAVAQLKHPNIVQVYEVGEHAGLPYFSLEYCPGGSLAGKLAGTPMPAREAAALTETVAGAVQAAHARGIVHRDLKPANVLLAEDGTPKVTDFGIAKRLDREAGQTGTGAILGTPSYMAPEQAEGRTKEVGPPVDIYALGAMLYELLTGRPPFRAATALETVRLLVSEEPVAPSRLQPGVPRDLETICLKCLEKVPARRYGSAAALANDLRRWLDGRPITARPVGNIERAWRWGHRNPGLAVALSTAVAAIALGTMVSINFGVLAEQSARGAKKQAERADEEAKNALEAARRADGEATNAREAVAQERERKAEVEQQREQAQQALARESVARTSAEQQHEHARQALVRESVAKERAEHSLYLSCITQAGANVKSNEWSLASQFLFDCPVDLRHWEWHYLHRLSGREHKVLRGFDRGVASIAFHPNGRVIAAGGMDGVVKCWPIDRDDPPVTLTGHTDSVHAVAFDTSGNRLVTASADSTVKVWDVDQQQVQLTFARHRARVFALAFVPGGKLIASSDQDGVIYVWDWERGDVRSLLHGPRKGAVSCLVASPDGRLLVSGGDDKIVRVWDMSSGKQLQSFSTQANPVTSVALDSQGKVLAFTAGDPLGRQRESGELSLRRFPTGERIATTTETGGSLQRVCFAKDSQSLVTAGAKGSIRIWRCSDLTLERDVYGHSDLVWAAEFGPSTYLASAGNDTTVRLWRLDRGPSPIIYRGHTAPVHAISHSPDGQFIASGNGGEDRPTPESKVFHGKSQSGVMHLWEAATGRHVMSFAHPGAVSAVAFAPNARDSIATGCDDGHVRLWKADGQCVADLYGNGGPVLAVTFDPSGDLLASVGSDGIIRVWEVAPRKEVRTFPNAHSGNVFSLSFIASGKELASAGEDHVIRIWSVNTGRQLRDPMEGHASKVHCLSWSAPNGLLASGSYDGTVMIWDAKVGHCLHVLRGHRSWVSGVAFSQDGRRLVSTGGDGEIRLWETKTWRCVLDFQGHNSEITSVSFNSAAASIATGSVDRTVRVWTVATDP